MEGLGRWYLCTKLTDWTASIRRTSCRSRTRTRVEWQRTQLADCPAQHGGAKRQQRSDLAAWRGGVEVPTHKNFRAIRPGAATTWPSCVSPRTDAGRLANGHELWLDSVQRRLGLGSTPTRTCQAAEATRGETAMHAKLSRLPTKTDSCCSALTFDMRGGRKWAKPACGRPLDGRVSPLPRDRG